MENSKASVAETKKLSSKILIKKEVKEFFVNKANLQALMVVFLIAVMVPVLVLGLVRNDPLALDALTYNLGMETIDQSVEYVEVLAEFVNPSALASQLFINSAMPGLFLILSIMVTASTAATSFVGEKEKKTLETLFYLPISLKSIFHAKITVSLLTGFAVTYGAFALMFILVQVLSLAFGWGFMTFGLLWFPILLIIIPLLSLLVIILIVRISSKANTSQSAMQQASLLVIPVMIFVSAQFAGIVHFTPFNMAMISTLLSISIVLFWRRFINRFNYEELLK